MIEVRTERQARALVLGATILGTGGGGSPSRGLAAILDALRRGLPVRIVDVGELPEEGFAVTAYNVGSIAPGAAAARERRIADPLRRAVEELEKVLGGRVAAIVPNEMGGGNTAAALSLAAELGVPAVDGDLVGRAAPEVHQCSAIVAGVPLCPSAAVTASGDVVVVKEYASIDDYEAVVRHLSVLGGGRAAVADTPMRRGEAARAVVRGTVSRAMRVGEEVLRAREEGRGPVAAATRALGGWRVFEGVVERYEWRDEGGFLLGEAVVRGTGEYRGRTLRTWIKNEHIMVWVDGEPAVMPPDLFSLLRDDGEPVTNTELKVGDKVHGVAAKAPEIWRTPEGLRYFGPRHFGFDYDYVPVEELVERALRATR
ncbi:DUF917 domain-containing protein [Thermofilum pendens]|uniref:DUF917 domain-containing protein n=1 Tax=Thermofilum pendens (strain DSM 2475 / Hrk 5) TaxID=368408 RepID=A1RZW4_THEPD|nr:DUF917 domain-containing protein [Thermofilum pendens]ABL78744.1 protein of unknown function DUF917 [Thermofilum pendens Hrk 5]